MFNLSRSKLSLVALTLAVILAFAAGQDGNSTTTTTTTTTAAPNTTTTTTPVPITTTPAPTTTTTTTPVPPPTPAPTPVPDQIEGNVTTGADNHTCIRYQFSSINLMIQYPLEGSNSTVVANISIPIGANLTNPKDTCSSATQQFTLSSVDASKNHSVSITFGFTSNSNSVVLDFLEATAQYNEEDFKNVSQHLIGTTYKMRLNGTNLSPNFNVEKTHSYSCGHVAIPKTETGPFHAAFKGLRIQAFIEKDKKGQFSSEHNCQSEINDVVPIAVGAALTGLVIIVMIAYFIGRRRSRRLTYQSV